MNKSVLFTCLLVSCALIVLVFAGDNLYWIAGAMVASGLLALAATHEQARRARMRALPVRVRD